MSRPARQGSPAPRWWSFPSTAMQRLRVSWTRWRLSRAVRRQERLRAKLAPVLVPLLQEQLELLAQPMALALGRLDDRQKEMAQEVLANSQRLVVLPEQLQVTQVQPMAELRELLVEILQTLQPPAEEQLWEALETPTPKLLPPSSAS